MLNYCRGFCPSACALLWLLLSVCLLVVFLGGEVWNFSWVQRKARRESTEFFNCCNSPSVSLSTRTYLSHLENQ